MPRVELKQTKDNSMPRKKTAKLDSAAAPGEGSGSDEGGEYASEQDTRKGRRTNGSQPANDDGEEVEDKSQESSSKRNRAGLPGHPHSCTQHHRALQPHHLLIDGLMMTNLGEDGSKPSEILEHFNEMILSEMLWPQVCQWLPQVEEYAEEIAFDSNLVCQISDYHPATVAGGLETPASSHDLDRAVRSRLGVGQARTIPHVHTRTLKELARNSQAYFYSHVGPLFPRLFITLPRWA
ncbi:hypothetical protein V8D89_015425 [Ganoderma adspersum]